MFISLIRDLIRRGAHQHDAGTGSPAHPILRAPIRLHVGGQVRHPDWKILDVRPGPDVDYVCACTELSVIDDESVSEIYASHVIEHLGYQSDLARALREFNRVLVPQGILRISVPDLRALCGLFVDSTLSFGERFHVMRMMFGGQVNEADFHYVGLDEAILTMYLQRAGFRDIVRVDNFELFADASSLIFKGTPISLNLNARRPPKV